MKYSAINIGPIIATLGMARKPRELWAASFLFSHLMKCIYGEAEKTGATIISPAKPKEEKNKVGIYPDRIYLKGEVDVKRVISEAVISFYYDLLGDKTLEQQLVAFSELGMEALYRLKVERYPAIIAAAHGRSIY